MIKQKLILFASAVALIAGSCEPDTPPTPMDPEGKLLISTETLFNGAPVDFNSFYTTAAGEEIQITYLKYFLGDIKLFDSKDKVLFEGGYAILTPSDGENDYEIGGLDFRGDVAKVTLSIGVDSVMNHADPAAMPDNSALNPFVHQDMYWTWNSGFIFIKNEGKYVESNGDTSTYLYHLGLDEYRADYSFQISEGMDASDRTVELDLSFDLSSLFNDPNQFHIETAGSVSHSAPWDSTMVPVFAENLKNVLSLR